MTKPLTQQQLDFRDWLILPDAARKELGLPETQKEYAAMVGVHQDTLTDWKRIPDFRPSMIHAAWTTQVIDRLPKALAALLDGAAITGKDGARDRATLMRMPLIDEGVREILDRTKATEDDDIKTLGEARTLLLPEEYDELMENIGKVTDTIKKVRELKNNRLTQG